MMIPLVTRAVGLSETIQHSPDWWHHGQHQGKKKSQGPLLQTFHFGTYWVPIEVGLQLNAIKQLNKPAI